MEDNSSAAGAAPIDPVAEARPAIAFLKEPTYEALERICDAHLGGNGDGVTLLDIHQHNACNHTLSGTINIDGVVHGFIVESGDMNGTVVLGWGDPEDVGTYTPPPPPEPLTFIPTNPLLFFEKPAMWGVYVFWRTQPWFAEKERAYAYDRHFQPGGKIEQHYRDWAAPKGLRIGLLSDLPAEARAALSKAGV